MDLIKREDVKTNTIDIGGYNAVTMMTVEKIPSAFKDMTFGEVFKSVFANYIGGVYVGKDYVEVAFNDIKTHISYYPTEVWDSPYKGVSE